MRVSTWGLLTTLGIAAACSRGTRATIDGPRTSDDGATALVLPSESLAIGTAFVHPPETTLTIEHVTADRVDKDYAVESRALGGDLTIALVDFTFACAANVTPHAAFAWSAEPVTPDSAQYREIDATPLRLDSGATRHLHMRIRNTAGCDALDLRFTAQLKEDARADGQVTSGSGPTPQPQPSAEPTVGAWKKVATDGAPGARSGHSSVWTGTEMVIFGGRGSWVTGGLQNSVAAFDPKANAWRDWSATAGGAVPVKREHHAAVWTGANMLIWGGETEVGSQTVFLDDGASFDPLTQTWTPISGANAPKARIFPHAVWTGDRMLVWGGACGVAHSEAGCGGGAYFPASDTWQPMSDQNAPLVSVFAPIQWTGGKFLAWSEGRDAGGGLYDPLTDAWAPINRDGAPHCAFVSNSVRQHEPFAATLWDGDHLIVTGHEANGPDGWQSFAEHVYVYDVAADHWRAVAAEGPKPETATGLVGFATAKGVYLISTDQRWQWAFSYEDRHWRKLAEGAPTPRYQGSVLWTGQELIVWGGRTADPYAIMDDGAVFTP